MKKDLKDFGKIFSFTFFHQVHAKSYILVTVLLACLCLGLPAAGMYIAEQVSLSDSEGGEQPGDSSEEGFVSRVDTVFVVDKTRGESIDFSYLSLLGEEGFQDVVYTDCNGDMDEAAALAETTDNSLILVLDKRMDAYHLQIVLPDDSALEWEDAWAFEDFINQYFQAALIEKSGLDYSSLGALNTPVYTQQEELVSGLQSPDEGTVSNGEDAEGMPEEEADEGMDLLKMILSFVLPFLNIMVLYFMVLLYGQAIAGNVILEKSSKLMDTFLVSVKPWTMIFGKVFAIVAASSLQLLLWLGCLAGGFTLGTALVKTVNPETEMLLVAVFESLSGFTTVFSLPGTILGVLILLSGFMLYSTLASICGAVVEKQEDLSSSITLFTMVLIISFFCTLYGGMMNTNGTPEWMDWVPFTATLITPSRLMLGDVSIAAGLGSLAMILVSIFLLMLVAGKLYQMMALYKGKAPGIGKLIRMLRNK